MQERGRWRELPSWVQREAYAETIFLGKFMIAAAAVISLMLLVGRQPDLIPGVGAMFGGVWFLAFLGLVFYWPWAFRSWQRRQLRKRGVAPTPHEAPPHHQRLSAVVEIVVGAAILFLFGLALFGSITEMVGGTAPENILAGVVIIAALIASGLFLLRKGWSKWKRVMPARP